MLINMCSILEVRIYFSFQKININRWKAKTSIINLYDYEIKCDLTGLDNNITLSPNHYPT